MMLWLPSKSLVGKSSDVKTALGQLSGGETTDTSELQQPRLAKILKLLEFIGYYALRDDPNS
jgi:hypothetical protein